MEYIALMVSVLFFVLLEAFFSGSELALVSVNRAKLNLLAKKDRALKDFLNNTESYITLTMFGYTFSIVFATVFYTYFWIKLTSEKYPFLKGYEPLLAETLLIFTLIFGEIIPKSIFLSNAEFLTPLVVKIFYPLRKLFYPIVKSAELISRCLSKHLAKGNKYLTKEELIKLFSSGKVYISKTKALIIANILSFRERTISEIVKPLYEVVTIDENATVYEAGKKIKESGYSRLPVYAGTLQNIVGYVQAYDLLKAKKSESIKKYIRPIKVIGEFERLKEVLDYFIKAKEHIAVVVDERGIVIGIVTLEDIVEEITGELYEKRVHEEEEIKQISPNQWIISANIEISELNKQFNLNIPKGIYSTLGGFIQYKLGKIPKKGETLNYKNYTLKVIDADEKKIKKVLVIKN
ncbi:MAG TPA: HlyC/CorC family transporter [Aquifex aeolicus]|uniref:HlyC/CorC family transporter n=1 Tax=Aquifex aeolicus TaxID=63363 RepID=A0A9D0YNX7_AQUAO|nr:HlyC/CorC family transporter [Aquificales bacterium]HIP86642.1 HlyC/CorC family transporter [Aquifex sp.]HIP97772.1 HlyC/CorC family transporter [Aquifex aeolicus]HIQ26490.1 HlyC/CorC family transporter [Aquifex aeolicus]